MRAQSVGVVIHVGQTRVQRVLEVSNIRLWPPGILCATTTLQLT